MNQELLTQVAEQLQRKYYGKYRGFVADNHDPQGLGRLRVTVPSVLAAEQTGWALPCTPLAGPDGHGFFMLPEVGAQVWVEFEEGELSRPLWTGVLWQRPEDVPGEATENQPTTRLIKTPSGHLLQFDDAEDAERVRLFHRAGAELAIDEQGSVTLSDAAGATVVLDAENNTITVEDTNGNSLVMDSSGVAVQDAQGNKIEMAASGITVQGQQIVISGSQVALGGQGGEPLVKGTSFLTLFSTHTHVAPPLGGPTSPPATPMTPAHLSTSVMTK